VSKMRNCFTLIAALAVALVARAGADDSVTCQQTDEILAELRQIRKLLENRPDMQAQPTTARIDVAAAPFLGSKDAPLTIVQFTDYQCQFCQRFHQQTFQDLKKHYIDSGKVRFYSLDLPLVDIHQNALLAAQAGRCAQDQGQFWAMHDQMQANPEKLEMAKLVEYAQESGIDVAAFRQCVESGKYKEDVQQGARDATTKGVRGTPAFITGKSTPFGVEGELVMGAVPYGLFEKKVKELAP